MVLPELLTSYTHPELPVNYPVGLSIQCLLIGLVLFGRSQS